MLSASKDSINEENARRSHVHFARHTASDVDESASIVSGWALQYDQLSPGRFQGETLEIRFRDVQFIREKSNRIVRQTGTVPAASIVFGLPMAMSGDGIFFGNRVNENDLMVCPRDGNLDFRTPATMDLTCFSISSAVFADALAEIGGVSDGDTLNLTVKTCASQVKVDSLKHLITSLYCLADWFPERLGCASIQKNLEDTLILGLIESVSTSQEVTSLLTAERRKNLVANACEFALAQPDDSVSILEMCKKFGTSRRKLNYCFQEVLGISPLQYLRALRLNGARRDLKMHHCDAQTVQYVAFRWGFWHVGQFGVYYKAMFGECPSETLRKTYAASSDGLTV